MFDKACGCCDGGGNQGHAARASVRGVCADGLVHTPPKHCLYDSVALLGSVLGLYMLGVVIGPWLMEASLASEGKPR